MVNIITIKNLSFTTKKQKILKNINLTIKKGKITTLIGPNGAGKSSIVKSLAKLIKFSGSIYLDNKNLVDYKDQKKLAQKIGFVHQQNYFPSNMEVWQYLKFGREPYKKNILSQLSPKDLLKIDEIIKVCDLKKLLSKKLGVLSGGELQKVHLALGLIQDPNVLVIDEPINNLDINYRYYFLDLIQKINKQYQKTIILVLHDINLAANYSDEIVVVKNGQIEDFGSVLKIITEEKIAKIFKIKPKIIKKNQKINIYFKY